MLRFVPNPNRPIPSYERRYGYLFEVTPIRAYDSSERIEDMETYLDVEPAVPSDVGSARSKCDSQYDLLEATDFDTKRQYVDRIRGRMVLPSLTHSERQKQSYVNPDALPQKFESTPTLEGNFEGEFGTDTVVSPSTLDINLPAKATGTSTIAILAVAAFGAYLLYKTFSGSGDEYPAHKLPRYAGGKRRL